MSHLWMTLEADKGTQINHCVIEAVRIATILRVTIKFVFNDLLVSVEPDQSAEKVLECFWTAHSRREAVSHQAGLL